MHTCQVWGITLKTLPLSLQDALEEKARSRLLLLRPSFGLAQGLLLTESSANLKLANMRVAGSNASLRHKGSVQSR